MFKIFRLALQYCKSENSRLYWKWKLAHWLVFNEVHSLRNTLQSECSRQPWYLRPKSQLYFITPIPPLKLYRITFHCQHKKDSNTHWCDPIVRQYKNHQAERYLVQIACVVWLMRLIKTNTAILCKKTFKSLTHLSKIKGRVSEPYLLCSFMHSLLLTLFILYWYWVKEILLIFSYNLQAMIESK